MVPPCGHGNLVPGTRWLTSTSPVPVRAAATSCAHTGQLTTISFTMPPDTAKPARRSAHRQIGRSQLSNDHETLSSWQERRNEG
jgi:hypothetical protein